jgi:hypothetical protein
MNPSKALWEKGDFTRIAASMRESGEALVADLRVRPGIAMLDVRYQRTTTSKSETSVTVQPPPGPSFDCEASQTHSLEGGGPDDLLSRPHLSRHVIY